MNYRAMKGFTLAELMIALVILGVIAALAIPKILSSVNSSSKTKAVDMMAAVSQAFETARLQKSLNAGSTFGEMLEYLNYSSVDTGNSFSAPPSGAGDQLTACDPTSPCLVFPGGVYLQYDNNMSFGGTSSTGSIIYVNIDVDGTAANAGGFSYMLAYGGRTTTGGKAMSAGISNTPGGSPTIRNVTGDPDFLN